MATYLLCSSPIYGHVVPLVEIGRYLRGQGHQVGMLTGARFEDTVTGAGLRFLPLPEACDFDDRDLDSSFPGRAGKKGLDRLRFDMTEVFINALPHQYRALREELDRTPTDAVLAESGFTGAVVPLLRTEPRPPILFSGIIPLAFSSRDTAPFGPGLPPLPTKAGMLRNLLLNTLIQKVVFRPTHRAANRQMKAAAGVPLPVHFLDAASLADRFLQFTCPGFEYPRSDLPASVRFVGPVLPAGSDGFTPPFWWGELRDGRPVIHVTQGTIDNKDPGRLILPTLRALARLDVLVVATTGGAPLPPGDVPPNARVADFLPHEHLLPLVDVMITNGGYGGTQRALAEGLPVIVAGDREDKPEVAARVAWAGVGINLRTGSPSPRAVRKAVRQVLSDTSYREAAGRLASEYARYDALPMIARELETTQAGPPRGRGPSGPGRKGLALVSAAQLVLGVAGLRRALRKRTAYDIGFLRGSSDTIERDQWLTGTNLSAPGGMLVLQAACIAALLRGPSRRVARTLGVLGAIMTGRYPAERSVRASWRRPDDAVAPLTAAAALLAALMAALGFRAAGR
ncbi:glycosyltransferase [Arthrobacter crusticola]|uniref:Glycosyltransferase n=1 Tax=Arthrobacter crusticola TaxID=2547960 RepID=A0A4R5TX59_9MICC|nr:nucleotide disphospho-sugar-binding domain-containing protein [Arthrobacter crusticola]TDK25757.1 glycosyltransferase [Arthrobacter crusticola]